MNNLSRLALGAAFLGFTGAAAAAPTEAVLYSFKGSQHRDGNSPQSDLIADASGNLYGTTQAGGTRGGSGAGTVFRLTPTDDPDVWTKTAIYDFQGGGDGSDPIGGLAMDAKGALYGTTENGGAMNDGTVFRLEPPKPGAHTWHKSVLYSFCAATNCADGAHPIAGVTLGKKGVLYGTTQFGGTGAFQANEGTAFQLTATGGGAWTETVIHSFCSWNDCADGYEPDEGRLLRSASGILYGTTTKSDSAGVVYALTPSSGSYGETVLHDFILSNGDGRAPHGGVVADKAGNLYGTTSTDSGNGCGTVFQLSGSGDLSGYHILYAFCQNADHSDGAIPYAGVILTPGRHGLPSAIYGTTLNGLESADGGVVFKLTPGVGGTGHFPWNETVLYSFCSQTNCTDGETPRFGPLLELNGAFYGTTQIGGSASLGTVYRVTE